MSRIRIGQLLNNNLAALEMLLTEKSPSGNLKHASLEAGK